MIFIFFWSSNIVLLSLPLRLSWSITGISIIDLVSLVCYTLSSLFWFKDPIDRQVSSLKQNTLSQQAQFDTFTIKHWLFLL